MFISNNSKSWMYVIKDSILEFFLNVPEEKVSVVIVV